MAATPEQTITRALKRLAVLAAGESPSGDDLVDGIEALNEMVLSWAADGLAIATITLTGSLAAGSAEVGEIDTAKVSEGMFVIGAGVPASTLVKTIDTRLKLTMTQTATASGAGVSLTFTAYPFDEKLEGAIVALLAMRLAEGYGKTPGPILVRDAENGMKQLQAAFLHVPEAQFDPGLVWTPSRISGAEELI